MFLKFSFLLVFAFLTVQASPSGCRFSGVFGELYTCDASGITYSRENDDIDLSGVHDGTRKDANVRRIIFNDSQLVTVPARVFETFPGIEDFIASNVRMERINVGTLRNCSNLFNLVLDNNLITRLENRVFANCRSLFRISVNNNQIDFIEDSVFRVLFGLRFVSLENNRLTTMDPNWFRNIHTLETLLLGSNQIHEIEPESYRGTVGLNFMSLENNRITHVPARAFVNKWMQKLGLNNNLISSIGEGAFQGFGSRGRVRCILDLHDNLLTRLETEIFNGVPATLGQISISNNQINAIEPNFFELLSGTFSFLAQGNECIDQNIYLVTSETINGTGECFKNF